MKKTSTFTLALALLVLGIAGIAWAAQPTVDSPEAATVQPAPDEVAPAQGEDAAEVLLEDLFQDPMEMTGACCVADCRDEKTACFQACPPYGDPAWGACRDNCVAQYDECLSHC